ncbi:MAG: glucose-1-phosphate cytidylyltransferase [Prosthecobacter sp.]|uniref:glucose-1-phosphate cytidylyltransferase n=1 Tax=Prosthecobacter sp. TaxID=1965333 RepID=UPI0025DEBFD7|nr:glucose-1-phosphate cytidylyltransferase [Prosthecobacter sp.]MCF7787330.1 glucose-1-phosphate cytidylyltransferase [Prosthecobacter sp.]
MKVIILCGGLGTRLREETEYRPKPMVPVGGQPILWHIMKTYACHGFKDFALCLGYKGEVIKDYFRNYLWNRSDVTLKLGRNPQITYHNAHDEEDWTVTLLETGLTTNTGGRLRRAMQHIGPEDVLFTYGDGLTDSDIGATLQSHRDSGGLVTLTAVQPAGRFGELSMEGNVVQSFQEKPAQEVGYINGGYMVLDKSVIDHLGDDACSFEQETLQALASKGMLRAHHHQGFWQCMDTYREQQLLDKMWVDGKAPWKIW